MDADLRLRLLDDYDTKTLADKRITWGWRAEKAALPAVTINRIASGRSYSFSGPSQLSGDLIQIDCWAATVVEAKRLFAAVRSALEREAQVGGTRFDMSFLDTETDMAPEDVPGFGPVARVMSQFRIWWQPL